MVRTFAGGTLITAIADICQSETGFVQVRFGQQGVFVGAVETLKSASPSSRNLQQHAGQMILVKWKAANDVPAHEMKVFHYNVVAQTDFIEVRKEKAKEKLENRKEYTSGGNII